MTDTGGSTNEVDWGDGSRLAEPSPLAHVTPPPSALPVSADDVDRFECPACGRCAVTINDVKEKYCRACVWWTGDPAMAWQRPDLWLANNKTPPDAPYWPTAT